MAQNFVLPALLLLILLMVLLGLGLWRLSRLTARVRQEQRDLARAVTRQGNDLAGMSSAGVHLDRLLIEHDKRLRECLERFESISEEPVAGTPTYHGPIERVRQGASAEELVSEFGISPSEAKLLVRLHGASK